MDTQGSAPRRPFSRRWLGSAGLIGAGLLAGGILAGSHLAGAAYGYLFKRFDLRWSRLPWAGVRRPRLRIVPADPPREKAAPRPTTKPRPACTRSP